MMLGTIFALFQSNITTTDELVQYISDFFFHDASKAQIEELVATYSDETTYGSPFRTSVLNEWYPEFKRIAAILGDLSFTLNRRSVLSVTSTIAPSVPSWSYLSSYDYGTPLLGTFHGSDLLQVFFGILPNYASASFKAYYLSFVNTLDPNEGTSFLYRNWPQWSNGNLLMNTYPLFSTLVNDNFREAPYEFITANAGSLRI
jgi:carboxylesterase type B